MSRLLPPAGHVGEPYVAVQSVRGEAVTRPASAQAALTAVLPELHDLRHVITILIYHHGMPVCVNVVTVRPRKLAAVRRAVAPGEVGSAWGPAVGKVWDFIRSQPGLWTDGHNIFLYHHANQPGAPILCDFGVEVTRTFETTGEVYATETPEGEAAVAVHRGPYDRMNEAYSAIEEWMMANRRESAGHTWEIYGDPTPDPAGTETTVVHLLK